LNIKSTKFDGLFIIEPKVWGDERGYFFESYSEKALTNAGIRVDFVQDNEAKSSYGVLRGLHYQTSEFAQAKLVRVSQGEVLDIAVDIRPESRTYGDYYSVLLSEENKKQMLVPKGFAHGYIVLSETAIFQYKCDNFYSPKHEGGIKYDDPTLAIDWKVPFDKLVVSEKDSRQPLFGNHTPYKV